VTVLPELMLAALPAGRQCLHVWEYPGMIARIWRGAVRAEDATAYAEYVQRTGIEGYQRTPGNRGAWLLWRTEGDRAEFITMSFWESRAAVEVFAGQDIGKQSSIRMTSSS
jgi:heme-degrading monooxygenase HmoA